MVKNKIFLFFNVYELWPQENQINVAIISGYLNILHEKMPMCVLMTGAEDSNTTKNSTPDFDVYGSRTSADPGFSAVLYHT